MPFVARYLLEFRRHTPAPRTNDKHRLPSLLSDHPDRCLEIRIVRDNSRRIKPIFPSIIQKMDSEIDVRSLLFECVEFSDQRVR